MTSPVRAPELTAAEPAASSSSGHLTHERKPGDLDFELPPPAELKRGRAVALVGIFGLVLAGLFFIRWYPKQRERAALAAEAKSAEGALPHVQVVAPVVVSSDRSLALPGSVQPLEETIVYPRANGYIRKWHVDLGDKVAEGDVLADIDTPDLDQQIAQARAQLAQAEAALLQAKANSRFSKENFERYKQLAPAGLASQQDLDKSRAQAEVDQAGIGVADANIGAQRANAQLLAQLKSFARVTAPFGGRVTQRNIERGTLVSAGTATPLFRIAATDPVRVFVQVPQDVAPSVRLDTPAVVSIREFPGRTFAGKVAHAAGALDPTTRTMMTEVRVANPDGQLLTGMYAQVALTLPIPHRVLSIPASALSNDANGLRVAVVDREDHIHLVKVVIEHDTGPTIELASGIAPDDRIVKLASAELTEGRAVEVVGK
jgi:RND family efflux transporter MFP subunit